MADGSGSSGKSVKGILKTGKHKTTKPTFTTPDDQDHSSGIQWDEMNILMTEHPENKDYGHMKIDEPKTPYHEMADDDDEPSGSGADNILSPDDLAKKVSEAASEEASGQSKWEGESSGSEGDDNFTEEQRKHKSEFKQWRKKHYNEYQAVQRARELIKKDFEEAEKGEAPTSQVPSCPVEVTVSSPTEPQDSSMHSLDEDSEAMDDSSQT